MAWYHERVPLPSGLPIGALKGLDVLGIHAGRSAANLLDSKPFNFNCTFWRGTN